MNKYKKIILKRLTKGPCSIDDFTDMRCDSFMTKCLIELKEDKLVEHVTKKYEVYPEPSNDPIECDEWVISLKGMDYLAERNKELLWKSLPIGISLCALTISILGYLNTIG